MQNGAERLRTVQNGAGRLFHALLACQDAPSRKQEAHSLKLADLKESLGILGGGNYCRRLSPGAKLLLNERELEKLEVEVAKLEAGLQNRKNRNIHSEPLCPYPHYG